MTSSWKLIIKMFCICIDNNKNHKHEACTYTNENIMQLKNKKFRKHWKPLKCNIRLSNKKEEKKKKNVMYWVERLNKRWKPITIIWHFNMGMMKRKLTRIQSSVQARWRKDPRHSGWVSQTAEMVVAFDEGWGLELKCINLSPFAKDFPGEEHYNESID